MPITGVPAFEAFNFARLRQSNASLMKHSASHPKPLSKLKRRLVPPNSPEATIILLASCSNGLNGAFSPCHVILYVLLPKLLAKDTLSNLSLTPRSSAGPTISAILIGQNWLRLLANNATAKRRSNVEETLEDLSLSIRKFGPVWEILLAALLQGKSQSGSRRIRHDVALLISRPPPRPPMTPLSCCLHFQPSFIFFVLFFFPLIPDFVFIPSCPSFLFHPPGVVDPSGWG